jgi:hypothetical protein
MLARYFLLSSLVALNTGCMFATYTSQDVRGEIAAFVPRLPLAHPMPGAGQDGARVIELKGKGSLFNDAPLLDEGWLHGKMTQAEYVEAISSINEAVGQSLVGSAGMYSSSDIPEREGRKAAAAAHRVAALNAIWQSKGVRFTFQRGEEHRALVARRTTERSTDTSLYLRIE